MATPYVAEPVPYNAQVDSPEAKQSTGEPSNNPEEQNCLRTLQTLLSQAKKSRSKYDKNWQKYEAYYNGDQWYGRKRPKFRASPNANLIRPTIQTIIPIMTDTNPGIEVSPQEPSDYQFADILSKVVRSWWNKTAMDMSLVELLTDAMKLDVGIAKIIWNPDAENGSGDIECIVIDPRNVYVADGAIDFNKKCPWTIELYPATVGELKRKYPDKAKFIKATGRRRDNEETGSSDSFDTEIKLVSPVDKEPGSVEIDPTVSSSYEDGEVVWCAEMWIDDYAVEEIDLESDESVDGEPVKQTKRKYPLGKIVQAIPALGLVLAVGPSPYKDGMKPYVKIIDVVRPREFYGEGEVGPYIETQDMINRSLAVIYDYVALMTNPTWIVDMDSGVDPDMLTNQIGLVIPKKAGSTVVRESPPNLPPGVFNFYTLMRQLFDSQTGIHDVTQGRKPVGITAAEAISTMMEAAQTRLRLKERQLQVALRQMGFMVVSRILQFYTAPRVIKISGSTMQWPEFFEFYIEETPSGDYKYNTLEYEFDEDTRQFNEKRQGWQSKETKGLYDIVVAGGTALPFMKSQRGELAMRLFRDKVIDQQNLLEMLEWPNREELMRRMEEGAKEKAASTPPGPGGPPGMAPPPGMMPPGMMPPPMPG